MRMFKDRGRVPWFPFILTFLLAVGCVAAFIYGIIVSIRP